VATGLVGYYPGDRTHRVTSEFASTCHESDDRAACAELAKKISRDTARALICHVGEQIGDAYQQNEAPRRPARWSIISVVLNHGHHRLRCRRASGQTTHARLH
jgi:hypothetical protein